MNMVMVKKVDELVGNEKLAKTLYTWDYQIILQEGCILKPEQIKKIQELGVLEVMVVDREKTHDIGILKTEVESMAKEKVKDILGRHTYQHSDELAKIANTADHIISNILEDDNVIEKVFDIKQRSSDIYEHSISICSMSILTALKLNLDKQIIRDLGVACLLHDIGLRYLTVNYENRDMVTFSEKELTEYKKHPVYGYAAVKDENWISERSKNIILNHHERLDGSGYPLHSRDLPMECRIVSVCEAFDEMICGIASKRSKVYQAVEYLKTFRNVSFDKKAVDAFLQFTAVYPAGTQVITNEGELAVVIRQNIDFQDRPILRIIKDKNGEPVEDGIIKDMVKVTNIFIDKVL
jgi:HD-GYP domain-containing protein (c-di-GMP phosphodiesterase class II)